MIFEGLSGTPDLLGRRVRIGWSWALAPLETVQSLPDVLLRRKTRDFAFPPLVPGDPYLIYDSADFPPVPVPGVLQVTDLPGAETIEDGLRAVSETVSVAQVTGGVPQEVLRRTRTVQFDAQGKSVRVRDDLIDAATLTPGTPEYYELDDGSAPDPQGIAAYRSTVTPGEIHGLNRRLWEMMPEVYRRHDTTRPAASAVWSGVPEAGAAGGQLRRFADMFGMGFDTLRNSAEGLRRTRDIMGGEPRWLPHMGEMIGWDVSPQLPAEQTRNDLSTATRLFDIVGSVQAMRAMVGHQTGWRSQVGEFAQNIARASTPPRRSLWFRQAAAGGWQGGFDMGDRFGFPPGGAVGAGALPAVLTGATLEPFSLVPGGELTLTVDGGAPVRVRFGPDDFSRIEAATASEVAAVLNRAFDNIIARNQGGAVEVETVLIGPSAVLRAETARQSLLSLSDAPGGGPVPVVGGQGTVRLFYLQRNDAELSETTPFAPGSNNPAVAALRRTDRDIRVKSWGFGEWRGETALPDWSRDATGVAATDLPGGAVGVGFVANDRLHYAIGQHRPAEPARLASLRAEPFALIPGAQAAFRLRAGTEVFTVNAADYAAPAAATAAEIAAAMNAQFVGLTANAAPDGTVRIATVQLGDPAQLSVDLSASNAARAMGFAARDLGGVGRWDTALDWSDASSGPQVWNPVADPALVADPPGGVRMAWAEHENGRWQIRLAANQDRILAATPLGAAQRLAGGAWTVWTTVDGLADNDVRGLAADADATIWFATASGLSRRRGDGTWQSFTTIDGLVSDDLRGIAILPSGAIAVASALGLSEVDTGGAVSVTTAAPGGLIDNDISAMACEGTGALWLATPSGVSRRDPLGNWQSWTPADGLPASPPRGIAVAKGGRAALATGAGLALWEGQGWSLAEGLPTGDVRDVAFGPDGALWAATAAGLARWHDGRWTVWTTADGLPSNTLGSVVAPSEKQLLIGTPAGLAIGHPDSGLPWQINGLPQGLPSPLVVAAQGGWSAPRILSPGNAIQREPHLAREAGGDLWLLCAERSTQIAGIRDDWSLQLRRQDPATLVWAASQPVSVAAPGGSADRTPWAEPQPGGGFRVFFGTDRTGGPGIAHTAVDAAGIAAAPVLLPTESDEQSHPAALTGPEGQSWLFARADSPVIQAQAGALPGPGEGSRSSARVPEAAAASHRSGARTPLMAHAARHALRRRFADPGVYTPEYPDTIDADLPGSPHIYTRRTLGLYLRQSPWGKPITQDETARLIQMLNRHLPINLRIRLIVAPDPLTEYVYTPENDIGERWSDVVPFVDTYDGPMDSFAVAIPGLGRLIANDPGSLSADNLNPATLLRRTWFPDLI